MALLRAETFDLVAVDHHMPGKSGLEMLPEILTLPDHPAVVFVTGNDDTSVAVEAIHAGASDFVVKTVGESFFDLLAGRFRQAWTRAQLERDKRIAEQDLRAANERLELLVREVHHRVANSLQLALSFVSMQANQTSEPAARDALEATQNRIRAIAKVHHRLYTRDDITTIDLDSYLQTLSQELRDTLAQNGPGIRLELSTVPALVSPDTAVSVGVIVNELVSNAAKYAFEPGQDAVIEITLERTDSGALRLCVCDNGRGISGEAPQGTGLGTRIITAVARSLASEVVQEPAACGTRHCLIVTPLD